MLTAKEKLAAELSTAKDALPGLESKVKEANLHARLELESLADRCYREISCLENYTDKRQLVATGNLKSDLESVEEAADALDDALDAVRAMHLSIDEMESDLADEELWAEVA